jgi:hypothetical protein
MSLCPEDMQRALDDEWEYYWEHGKLRSVSPQVDALVGELVELLVEAMTARPPEESGGPTIH